MKFILQDLFLNLGGGVSFDCAQLKVSHCSYFKKKVFAIIAGPVVSNILIIFVSTFMAMPQSKAAPPNLIDVKSIDNSLSIDIAYNTRKNFMGRKVPGYSANACYLKEPAARALSRANNRLEKSHLKLRLRDCWRPSKSTWFMTNWAKETDSDRLTKNDLNSTQQSIFQDKRLFDNFGILKTSRLFQFGYLSNGYSQHNRGSTLDIDVLKWTGVSWVLADTGTPYDTFSQKSAFSAGVSAEARSNRNQLRTAMSAEGFRVLSTEWWHWTHNSNSGNAMDGEVD